MKVCGQIVVGIPIAIGTATDVYAKPLARLCKSIKNGKNCLNLYL